MHIPCAQPCASACMPVTARIMIDVDAPSIWIGACIQCINAGKRCMFISPLAGLAIKHFTREIFTKLLTTFYKLELYLSFMKFSTIFFVGSFLFSAVNAGAIYDPKKDRYKLVHEQSCTIHLPSLTSIYRPARRGRWPRLNSFEQIIQSSTISSSMANTTKSWTGKRAQTGMLE